jgi:hypothetical protein
VLAAEPAKMESASHGTKWSRRLKAEPRIEVRSRVFARGCSGAIANHENGRFGELSVAIGRNNPASIGNQSCRKGLFLSESLYYLDEEPLRAFFLIHLEFNVVEITDFRIL